jgi:large subunit ribosomal protein L4
MALSQKLLEQNLIIVDDLTVPTHKTSLLDKILLGQFGIAGKTGSTAVLVDDAVNPLISAEDNESEATTPSSERMVLNGVDANLKVASGNLYKVNLTNQLYANVYDILKHEKLVLSLSALRTLEQRLAP